MEKIRIDILGQEYTFVSDESPKYVRSLAKRLASHISGILEGGSNVPQNAAMALVAISYLDELEKSAANIEELKASNVALTDEIEKLKAEIEGLKAEVSDKKDVLETKSTDTTSFDGAQLKLI